MKQHPLQMIQRVATPYYIDTLLNIMLHSSPRNKITAIRILTNLIKIQLPFEVLEETINIFTRDPSSLAARIYKNGLPKGVELKESQFLRFVYAYILNSRHKMWNKLGAECKFNSITFKNQFIILNYSWRIICSHLRTDKPVENYLWKRPSRGTSECYEREDEKILLTANRQMECWGSRCALERSPLRRIHETHGRIPRPLQGDSKMHCHWVLWLGDCRSRLRHPRR